MPDQFAIRRLRPTEIAPEGLEHAHLVAVAAAALGLTNEDTTPPGSTDTFKLPPDASLNPYDRELIDEVSDWLNEAAQSADVVVLDINFERTQVRFGAIEQLLVAVGENIAPVWPSGTRLVVLVDRNPEEDEHFASILRMPAFEGAAVFVDNTGAILGDAQTGWTEAPLLAQAASLSIATRRKRALERSLRRRGAFRVMTSRREEYAAHKYSVDADELSALLAGFLTEHRIDVALFDDGSSPWLSEALLATVNLARNVRCFATSDVESSATFDETSMLMRERVIEAIGDPTKRVCIVVPMVKHATRLGDLVRVLEGLGRSDVVLLSVFLADESSRPGIELDQGWAYQHPLTTERLNDTVHYFFQVRLTRMRPDAWQVLMAKGFREDLHDRDSAWKPSVTGLWSMLDEYEDKTGYSGEDHGVLLHLEPDDWDSYWLAKSLVRTIEDAVDWNPKDMLAVVPDEPTAIRPIARALERRLGIAIAPVPREIIDLGGEDVPEHIVRKLKRFRDSPVVVLDESAASYRTIENLTRIVWNVLDRGPDLRGVVLDLPDQNTTRPADFFSIYGWRPLKREAG